MTPLIIVLALASPVTPQQSAYCTDLARFAGAVAVQRDLGRTKPQVILQTPPAARVSLMPAIDTVYAWPQMPPEVFQRAVRASCIEEMEKKTP